MSGKKFLYRIMRFEHAVQVLRGNLYFSHPSQWEDPYETNVKHEYDHAIFAQCWSTASMSDAMWRIYSPNLLGVRLRTTRDALASAMQAYTSANAGYQRRLQNVEYLKPNEFRDEMSVYESLIGSDELFGPATAADMLCVKRAAFSHEAEVRAILYDSNALRSESDSRKGINVKVDGAELIDSIRLDPRASDELCEALSHYFRNILGFKGSVKKSLLYTVSS